MSAPAIPPLQADLRHAQEATRDSLNEVRRVADGLRPGVLEDLGLVSALTELTNRLKTHTRLKIRRHVETGPLPLSRKIELVMYRIAQESLTNAARHANASNLDLTLQVTTSQALLSVTDDGQGSGHYAEGAGIRGMRERALLVGGRLTIEPARPGTRVCLCVPLTDKGGDHGGHRHDPDPAR